MSQNDQITCDVIRDLLPLYCDQQASEESISIIEAHLEECADCKEICEKMSAEISAPQCQKEDQAVIDSMKRMRRRARLKALLGIVIAALVCTGLFFVMFWGVVPVKSTDASIEYSARTYINDGRFFRSIEFKYALREGEVLNARVDHKSLTESGSSNIGAATKLYSVLKIPFDDRGENPNRFSQGFETTGKFAEGDVLVVEFSDKTVTYDLKEIAEEAGIQ